MAHTVHLFMHKGIIASYAYLLLHVCITAIAPFIRMELPTGRRKSVVKSIVRSSGWYNQSRDEGLARIRDEKSTGVYCS
ncbi:hypothetical protein BJV82DRAFT_189028 [Fennellomyces sp. T-0311]|nr:hypothetical protein BJV82DRAFT_189028 [Fennellomyces sp. T-0311]